MAERMLLANARVLTCSGDVNERPFDGDILISGGRIAKVAVGRLDVDPAAVRVVDVRGATVLPGLGDAHVHTSWPLDFVFDHAGIAAAPPAKHMLDVAAVARTFLESGYTLIIGAGTTQPPAVASWWGREVTPLTVRPSGRSSSRRRCAATLRLWRSRAMTWTAEW